MTHKLKLVFKDFQMIIYNIQIGRMAKQWNKHPDDHAKISNSTRSAMVGAM